MLQQVDKKKYWGIVINYDFGWNPKAESKHSTWHIKKKY